MRHRRVPISVAASAAGVVLVGFILVQAIDVRTVPGPSSTVVPVVPVASPSAAPPLHVDGLAVVGPGEGLLVWKSPSMTRSEVLEPVLTSGSVVYLTQGPRRFGGHDWWEIQPETLPDSASPAFGWVQVTDDDGRPTLVPFAPGCPPADRPIEAAAIRAIGGIVALACFGDETITLEGQVQCVPAVRDGGAAGPSWLDFYAACDVDEALALNGPIVTALLDGGASPPDPVTGRYRILGHFDDPEASNCHWIPVGVVVSGPIAPPEPDAVIACRQAFVVTALEPLGD